MFKIVAKKELNDAVTLLEIQAPFVAKKAQAGQFIIFRVDQYSERVPLTIADYDREKGTITIIFQKVGLSTKMLGEKKVGEYIKDFVGPLGIATEYENMKKVAVVGGGVGCAIAYPQAKALHQLGAEVDVITGFRDESIVILEEEKKKLENKMDIITEKIHNLRKENAQKLSEKINKELNELEMKNAKINVHVDYLDEYLKTGKDIVEFYIITNLGEDEKELSKIASGGEMSRTMLAIKKVLADVDETPILIFDEIDTGISGKAANSVAQKLKSIANNHQIMCISHLPNIAAIADYNYFISKNVINQRTRTSVKLLKEDEVVKEIARISSGEVNDITLKYANELRNKKAS